MKDAQGKRTGFKAGANGFGALDERAGWFRRRCRSTLLSEQSEQKNASRLQKRLAASEESGCLCGDELALLAKLRQPTGLLSDAPRQTAKTGTVWSRDLFRVTAWLRRTVSGRCGSENRPALARSMGWMSGDGFTTRAHVHG